MNQAVKSQKEAVNSPSQAITKIKTQPGQMTKTLNRLEEGKIPSPSNLKQVQAITTLRSGKMFDNHVEDTKDEQTEAPQNLYQDKGKQVSIVASSSSALTPELSCEPWVPFLERLKAPSHFWKQGKKIQDMMERKNRKRIPKKVLFTEQVSSLIQHSTPPKFNDPGAPTISCIIGNIEIEKAFLGLGAGVNLLPYSVYQQLGLGELKPTNIVLQLVDRSIKKSLGIVEDVIIKVDKFYFPVDFIVLDTEPVPNPEK
ncbi:uncharacterized protein LOC132164971 [Corylus avellana]|uniref:uncharacterized protein LOC132164971 n=1 Tax=Corylus avellana TaxID=13451 RepID=UPI00286C1BE3|nr:uncharacterized protein LOC132164971 [Corylus avellana]